MNIHINEQEFNRISKNVLVKVIIGSHMYKMSNIYSDIDELNITANLEDNLHSLVQLHHQYQYKNNNIDFLFCSLQSFVKNIIMGDSTINFESLYSDEIRNHSSLKFLYDFRKNFYNYNLIRAYLGLVRRDLKFFKKEKNNKRLFHALRGVLTAKTLLNGSEYSNDFKEMDENTHYLLIKIKNSKLSKEEEQNLAFKIDQESTLLRFQLNQKLENKEINKIIRPFRSNLKKVDNNKNVK
jgi:hypothetical protein